MANRDWHVAAGIIFAYLIPLAIIWYVIPSEFTRRVVLLGLITILGAELPDFDHLDDNEKFLSHRDILTHSALIPFLLFVLGLYACPPGDRQLVGIFLFFLNLGYASHLFLDEFPVWEAGMAKKAALWFAEGITGAELVKQQQGTFLVHLHWFHVQKHGKLKDKKTLGRLASRLWYFFMGWVCITMALYSIRAVIPMPFLPF